jgi:hypothetical protein
MRSLVRRVKLLLDDRLVEGDQDANEAADKNAGWTTV